MSPHVELKCNVRNTPVLLAALFALSAALLGLSGCSTMTEREHYLANSRNSIASRPGDGAKAMTVWTREERARGLAVVDPP